LIHARKPLTRIAVSQGLRSLLHQHPDPAQIQALWDQLPSEARTNNVNWSARTSGQIVGGMAVSGLVSTALIRQVRLPRPIVLPAMLVVNFQGAMAALWRDA
jgi:hypothetical protein